MPMLSILAVHDCDSLKTFKALNGLEHLQEVAIYNMPEIVDNIKLQDEKLFSKIKCLTTPRMVTDRGGFPGRFVRMLDRPDHVLRVAMASESRCSDM
jgi:hypothetical protein